MRTYSSGNNGAPRDLLNYFVALSQSNNPNIISLAASMINDAHRYLLEKYFFNESSASIQTIGDQQFYNLPYDYSKLKTGTITIGNLKWTPTEILSREDWDKLNTITNYYSDIPNNYFIYNGQIGFWPTPSTGSTALTYTGLTGTLVVGNTITAGSAIGKILTFTSTTIQVAVTSQTAFANGSFTTSNGATGTITAESVTVGNTITFNYKRRVTDLTLTDYTTSTVSATNGSNVITGSGTGFVANYLPSAGSVLNLNLWIQLTAPLGDNNWYQVSSLDSATQLTLVNQYQGPSTSGANYILGQTPLLLEDFQDLLVYRPLTIYFSTINKDTDKLQEFRTLYVEGIERLNAYAGTKALQVNLRGAINTINPNVYISSIGGSPS